MKIPKAAGDFGKGPVGESRYEKPIAPQKVSGCAEVCDMESLALGSLSVGETC